jgi:hypothetical protein
MNDFTIGNTSFGIDPKASRFGVTKEANGRSYLTVEIQGSKAILQELAANKKSGWSWMLYPPNFYLRKYPVHPSGYDGELTFKLKPEDYSKYETAMTLEAHERVRDSDKTLFHCGFVQA